MVAIQGYYVKFMVSSGNETETASTTTDERTGRSALTVKGWQRGMVRRSEIMRGTIIALYHDGNACIKWKLKLISTVLRTMSGQDPTLGLVQEMKAAAAASAAPLNITSPKEE